MIVVGVDPGLTGALAACDGGALLWVEDMPVVDKEVNPTLLRQLLRDHEPIDHVVIEQVAAFPKNGSIGNFKLGLAYGIALGVAAVYPHSTVRPTVWKKRLGLTSDKERSRKMAIDLWPEHSDWFKRKKDDGRAEAALLARGWVSP